MNFFNLTHFYLSDIIKVANNKDGDNLSLKRKISLTLIVVDVLVIVMVMTFKGNSTVNVKAKDTVSAANVLVQSQESLDTYINNEIEEYIVAREEAAAAAKAQAEAEAAKKAEEEAAQARLVAQEQARQAMIAQTAPVADTSYGGVAGYAAQFVGNPYVYGGTSLTNGADCSGFVMSVYANFGVSLPRTAGGQATVGEAVSIENAQPGDIISYGYNGVVSHSAIYAGNNTIIHASTPSLGIRTDSMYIMPIVTIRRVG